MLSSYINDLSKYLYIFYSKRLHFFLFCAISQMFQNINEKKSFCAISRDNFGDNIDFVATATDR